MGDLLVLPKPAESLQNGAGLSRKTSGLPKRKEWPQATKRAVSKDARAAFSKKKRNRVISSDHKIVRRERIKVIESRTSARKKWD